MKHPARGFALPTLLVMLALASIATLLAMRNLWVNEQLFNAEADQLRAQHKAEAVLPVALIDILGATNNNSEATPNPRHTAGDTTQTHAFFPNSMVEYNVLRQRLGANTCSAGICAPHALNASATPGADAARDRSTERMRACATWLRTNTALIVNDARVAGLLALAIVIALVRYLRARRQATRSASATAENLPRDE